MATEAEPLYTPSGGNGQVSPGGQWVYNNGAWQARGGKDSDDNSGKTSGNRNRNENKEFGGWYHNPDAGKTQRWWGDYGWTDGDDPTSGAGAAPESDDEFIDSIFSSADREIGFLEKFTEEHPFSFDEELARKSSEAEYEPYYTELLDDYLQDVGVKREAIGEENKLLDSLRTSTSGQSGQATRAYTRAVSQAKEGFAGSGMFFSGIKKRALGESEVERESDVRQTATGVQRKERDVGREQKEAVEGGVLQREGEEIKKYNTGLSQLYARQFPSSGGGTLAGYTVPSQLRF